MDAKNIIGVKDGLEIFGGEEVSFQEMVQRVAVRVVIGGQALDALKTLNDVELGIGWARVQNVSQDLLKGGD